MNRKSGHFEMLRMLNIMIVLLKLFYIVRV